MLSCISIPAQYILMSVCNHYLGQLLDTLQQARQNKREFKKQYAYLQDLQSLDYSSNFTISDVFGLAEFELPPEHKLSEQQLDQLSTSMVDTLLVYGIEFAPVDTFEELPAKQKYQIVKTRLNRTVCFKSEQLKHIELCSMVPSECSLGPYCRCCNY